MENLFYALIPLLIFSFFDYWGYNVIKWKVTINWFVVVDYKIDMYRVIQTSFQIFLIIITTLFDVVAAAIFILLWLFWISDFIYYFMFDTLKWYGGKYAGKAFKSEVLGDKVYWAWWTIFGLIITLHRMSRKRRRTFSKAKSIPIKGNILILQGIIGLLICMFISKIF